MFSKGRAPKRAVRRNGSERIHHFTTTLRLAHMLPGHQTKVSTRNKYLLWEERERGERRGDMAEEEMQCEGKEQSTPAASVATRRSSSTLDKSSSHDRMRLRMTRVDGVNSTAGPTSSPKRGKVSCSL